MISAKGLLTRLAALEAVVAEAAAPVRAVIVKCAGPKPTASDRRRAANLRGNAEVVVFRCTEDFSSPN